VKTARIDAIKVRKVDKAKVDVETHLVGLVQGANSKVTISKSSNQKNSKATVLLDLLRQPEGVSLKDLCLSSGWQAHSVRGFLSGTVGKKLGLGLKSVNTDGGRIYRIVSDGVEGDEAISISEPSIVAASEGVA